MFYLVEGQHVVDLYWTNMSLIGQTIERDVHVGEINTKKILTPTWGDC
jgi:hypothetical protein